MIDFAKPVTVRLTGYRTVERAYKTPGPLKPDLSLMMEDFLERGDNTRLFVAKIPLKP